MEKATDKYQYTLHEGGTWYDLPFSLPEEEMIKRCRHEGNWGDCGPEIYAGEFNGHTKRTLIIENPDDDTDQTKTVAPDGKIVPTN